MAQALARYTNGNAHIIICGRNQAAAEAVIGSFPKPIVQDGAEKPVHEFVHCDATLMKNVGATVKDLLARLPKLNYLVLSPGIMVFRGRDETEEGIDKKLAVHYYARWKFINDLLPLLRKAKDAGQDAKVFSVLGAGKGGDIDLDDLGLKKNFSLMNAGLAAPTYNDLMMEAFFAQNPDMAFTHAYPGMVRTPLAMPSQPILRPVRMLMYGIMYPFTVAPDECAEFMLHALFNGENGAFRRGSKGEDIGKTRYFGSEEARKKLWDHTVEATLY